MRVIAVIVLIVCCLLSSCTVTNSLCTEEDQQAGTCTGPAGGWPASVKMRYVFRAGFINDLGRSS